LVTAGGEGETVKFKPLKHTQAQEVSVQSKTPKSFTFCYRIKRTFGEVTGMVVDNDDNLILADKSFLAVYELNTIGPQCNNNSTRLFVAGNIPCVSP
jgi:hypothetical protein